MKHGIICRRQGTVRVKERQYSDDYYTHSNLLSTPQRKTNRRMQSFRPLSRRPGWLTNRCSLDWRQAVQQLEAKVMNQELELRTAKQEKEFYERQYSALKSGASQAGMGAAGAAGGVSERELASVLQERDFFSAQLSALSKQLAQVAAMAGPNAPSNTREEFETAVAEKRAAVVGKIELEAKVRALAEEAQEQASGRREAEGKSKQLQTELQKLQDAAIQQLPPSSQTFISEIRKSRDAALAELDALKKDRDTLRSKMKQVTTQQARDGAASSETQRSLQQKVEQSKRIVTEQQQRLQTQANVLSGVQGQLQALQDQLQSVGKQLRDSNAQNNQLKSQLGSSAAELSEQLQELERRNRSLSSTDNRVRELTEQCDELSADGERLRRELFKLRAAHTELNDEHDRLMAELTAKKEVISAQAGQLQQRADAINSLQADVARLELQINPGCAVHGCRLRHERAPSED
ncbi:hypothetical protein FHG87_014434 [Trinorchestia longiramus]|nr:hypothetical protein FHG87_014434 [Trinorchestia longiramus]